MPLSRNIRRKGDELCKWGGGGVADRSLVEHKFLAAERGGFYVKHLTIPFAYLRKPHQVRLPE